MYLHRSEGKVFLVQWRSCLHASSSDSSKASGFSANDKEQNKKKKMNEEGERKRQGRASVEFLSSPRSPATSARPPTAEEGAGSAPEASTAEAGDFSPTLPSSSAV